MMTILVLRSFYYSGLSLWVSSFASVSVVLFPCLWFQRSRDSNDGGWLLLVFFLLLFVCSSVIVSLCFPVLFLLVRGSPFFSFRFCDRPSPVTFHSLAFIAREQSVSSNH
ncbi:hypothetical protein NC653_008319 [Populus alba x Populus x berolinensis]|uniref:Uncharacterized protein n=1 Tax=Populus alba x Populus x berolinensis TaxID=444605 RepID=A0AAD6R639_9ROSI|nr:hypothetical protein NC653_008319 [Populus alba x Populus x berolinensis]